MIMNLTLNRQIFWGLTIGIAGGIILNLTGTNSPVAGGILYASEIIGGIFIDLLKMILIPLIFTSITVGISNLKAHAQMNRIWKITLIYFLTTTALASLLGLISVNIFKPGMGLKTILFQESLSQFKYENVTLSQFSKMFFSDLFMNPVKAMAEGKVLPTVFFAIFLGIALIISAERGKNLQRLLNEIFETIMLIVGWIMHLAPLGIMALLLKLMATQDSSLLSALLTFAKKANAWRSSISMVAIVAFVRFFLQKSISRFILVVIGTTLFHGLITLPLILYIFTKMTPMTFFKGAKEALITAFSTSSSSATLPVTMQCVEKNLNVKNEIAGFVLPLGATVNMDGTALYEAVAAIFVANLTGIHLNIIQQIIVFMTAILASVGAPGIPSAGMVTMIMVLQAVGLPAQAIAILIPIDRFLDTIRTAVNVQGDMIGSVIIEKLSCVSARIK